MRGWATAWPQKLPPNSLRWERFWSCRLAVSLDRRAELAGVGESHVGMWGWIQLQSSSLGSCASCIESYFRHRGLQKLKLGKRKRFNNWSRSENAGKCP